VRAAPRTAARKSAPGRSVFPPRLLGRIFRPPEEGGTDDRPELGAAIRALRARLNLRRLRRGSPS